MNRLIATIAFGVCGFLVAAAQSTVPEFFTALQEQAGLKLEPRKAPNGPRATDSMAPL